MSRRSKRKKHRADQARPLPRPSSHSNQAAEPDSDSVLAMEPPTPTAPAPEPALPQPMDSEMAMGRYFGGFVFLGLAAILSVALVVDHFDVMRLPGCGEGGGCAQAAASKWGKVPGTSWPVSFVGLAFFGSLLAAWLDSGRSLPSILRQIVRVGALISVMFIVVMISQGYVCYYCLGAHAANLAFWILLETSKMRSGASLRPFFTTVVVFGCASAILGAIDGWASRRAVADLNRQADESLQEIIASSTQKVTDGGDSTTVTDSRDPEAIQGASDEGPGFTGRYRLGPEIAPIRLVIITDYQCPDCRAVEAKAREIMEGHDDVSLSIKHSPMDQSCNTHISRTLHSNACWAARVAEAAGLLRGEDGFWEMHHWLFDIKGSFTNQELREGLLELGYDPPEFIKMMTGDETLRLVQADADEAHDLGLFFTPMIFINGHQLRGVFAANAQKLVGAVEQLSAQHLPPLSAAGDKPPPALEKSIDDWREQPRRTLPPDLRRWADGPDDAKVRIVMWADYQEKQTARADRIIREWMEGRNDAQYIFRHFPFDESCNPVVTRTAHPLACRASRAAEAAGILGGAEGYWKMHDWLMANQQVFGDTALRAAAVRMGFEPDVLLRTIDGPEVVNPIVEDARAAKRNKQSRISLLYRQGIPTIYVNGKAVPRWRLGSKSILAEVLDAAAAE